MRQDVINSIHESHLGMEKRNSRARAVVYWPGISTAIERMISKYSVCLKYQSENQKELITCPFRARNWGFEVTTSSHSYPQSNGMSERAIQTIKQLLRKRFEDGNAPYIALLECRNTPVSGLRESPAQLLMSRMLKSKLPSTVSLLKPQLVHNAYDRRGTMITV